MKFIPALCRELIKKEKMKNPPPNRQILYRLIRLIQEISPKKNYQNPHQSQLEQLDFLDMEEQLLIADLQRAITQLNAHSRTNEAGQLIATESDLLNALQLIHPISKKCIETHEKLLDHFGEEPFTYLQVRVNLRISETTIRRRFPTLLAHKLIRRLSEKADHKAQFQAIAPQRIADDSPESPFETMLGDWKNFNGWVEF